MFAIILDFIKLLFLECTEKTTRSGFRVVYVNECHLVSAFEILQRFVLILGFEILFGILYIICSTIIMAIYSTSKWIETKLHNLLNGQYSLRLIFFRQNRAWVLCLWPKARSLSQNFNKKMGLGLKFDILFSIFYFLYSF